jgi:hypothetical protein
MPEQYSLGPTRPNSILIFQMAYVALGFQSILKRSSLECPFTGLIYTSCLFAQERLAIEINRVPEHAPQL